MLILHRSNILLLLDYGKIVYDMIVLKPTVKFSKACKLLRPKVNENHFSRKHFTRS